MLVATAKVIKENVEVKIHDKELEKQLDVKRKPYYVAVKHDLTPDQERIYKEVLYSKKALPFLNELKNSRLVSDNYSIKLRDHIFSLFKPKVQAELAFLFASDKLKSSNIEHLFGIKFIKALPRIRKVDRDAYQENFNRFSFKELGIRKEEVVNYLYEKGLIPFKIEASPK